MKKSKLIIKSEVDINVQNEVEEKVSTEFKKIIDELSTYYKRNIKAEVKVEVE